MGVQYDGQCSRTDPRRRHKTSEGCKDAAEKRKQHGKNPRCKWVGGDLEEASRDMDIVDRRIRKLFRGHCSKCTNPLATVNDESKCTKCAADRVNALSSDEVRENLLKIGLTEKEALEALKRYSEYEQTLLRTATIVVEKGLNRDPPVPLKELREYLRVNRRLTKDQINIAIASAKS